MDSLQPLGSLLDRELDLLILLQGAESIALDGGVMDKYVLCALTGDESISFGIIEPFDGSGLSFSHFSYSLIGVNLVKQWGQNKKRPPSFRKPGQSLIVQPKPTSS
jgi:hypothetical protein